MIGGGCASLSNAANGQRYRVQAACTSQSNVLFFGSPSPCFGLSDTLAARRSWVCIEQILVPDPGVTPAASVRAFGTCCVST